MSELDKAAIRIVEDLQKRIRNTTIALISIFTLAILSAVFWGGRMDNQVDSNTENIKELSTIARNFITDQRVKNENLATEEDMKDIKHLLQITNDNLNHLSFWAESRGYSGLPRGIDEEREDKK